MQIDCVDWLRPSDGHTVRHIYIIMYINVLIKVWFLKATWFQICFKFGKKTAPHRILVHIRCHFDFVLYLDSNVGHWKWFHFSHCLIIGNYMHVLLIFVIWLRLGRLNTYTFLHKDFLFDSYIIIQYDNIFLLAYRGIWYR